MCRASCWENLACGRSGVGHESGAQTPLAHSPSTPLRFASAILCVRFFFTYRLAESNVLAGAVSGGVGLAIGAYGFAGVVPTGVLLFSLAPMGVHRVPVPPNCPESLLCSVARWLCWMVVMCN